MYLEYSMNLTQLSHESTHISLGPKETTIPTNLTSIINTTSRKHEPSNIVL